MGRRHREGACVCVKVCACACIYLVPGVQSTEAAAGTHLRRPRPSQGEPDWLSETRDEHRGRTPQLISTCRPRRSGVDLGSSASRSRAFVRFLLRHPGPGVAAARAVSELGATCALRYKLLREQRARTPLAHPRRPKCLERTPSGPRVEQRVDTRWQYVSERS